MVTKVSVIMPSLNVAEYIEECVQSVMKQSLQEIEIICVDAGSSDGTRNILDKLSRKDARISVIESDVKSYGYQVNLGLQVARGEYIAIVETDDNVERNMFQRLYEEAIGHNLDYVKANFRYFSDFQGHRIYRKGYAVASDEAVSECTVIPKTKPNLFVCDAGIWTGLYRKDFLNQYHIRLNETKGAAYQDIGFLVQVQTYARRAMYLPDFLYYYRTDRMEASSYKAEVLQYVHQEFQWLLQDKNIEMTKGVALKLTSCFLCELDKVMRKVGYDVDSYYLGESYLWLQTHIQEAIKKGVINEQDFSEQFWKRLQLALCDLSAYANWLQEDDCRAKERDRQLVDYISCSEVVIFGGGSYGVLTLLLLKEHQKKIVALCDNERSLWGREIGGLPVLSPETAAKEYPHACFVVANKKNAEQMKTQLLHLGIGRIFCRNQV
ncbi:MAG: glycosyltransferase [Lachnospiraceae bacterium]|nr:glycosyltransferase [Lachnospiraceae bacterium]